MKPRKGQQGISRSFEHAYRGLVYVVRTQRNMRIHVVVSVLVLAASLLVSVSALELAALVIVIVLVLVTEMLNTALEFAVDLVTKEYHPLAKLAKDVSAGAVLVTSIGALLVGYLILADDLGPLSLETLERVRSWPGHLTVVSLGLADAWGVAHQGADALAELVLRGDALGTRGGVFRGLGGG